MIEIGLLIFFAGVVIGQFYGEWVCNNKWLDKPEDSPHRRFCRGKMYYLTDDFDEFIYGKSLRETIPKEQE